MFDAEVILNPVKNPCHQSHEKTPLESHKTIISRGFSQHLPILSRHINQQRCPLRPSAPKNGV
jgi:hypothetical protein